MTCVSVGQRLASGFLLWFTVSCAIWSDVVNVLCRSRSHLTPKDFVLIAECTVYSTLSSDYRLWECRNNSHEQTYLEHAHAREHYKCLQHRAPSQPKCHGEAARQGCAGCSVPVSSVLPVSAPSEQPSCSSGEAAAAPVVSVAAPSLSSLTEEEIGIFLSFFLFFLSVAFGFSEPGWILICSMRILLMSQKKKKKKTFSFYCQ